MSSLNTSRVSYQDNIKETFINIGNSISQYNNDNSEEKFIKNLNDNFGRLKEIEKIYKNEFHNMDFNYIFAGQMDSKLERDVNFPNLTNKKGLDSIYGAVNNYEEIRNKNILYEAKFIEIFYDIIWYLLMLTGFSTKNMGDCINKIVSIFNKFTIYNYFIIDCSFSPSRRYNCGRALIVISNDNKTLHKFLIFNTDKNANMDYKMITKWNHIKYTIKLISPNDLDPKMPNTTRIKKEYAKLSNDMKMYKNSSDQIVIFNNEYKFILEHNYPKRDRNSYPISFFYKDKEIDLTLLIPEDADMSDFVMTYWMFDLINFFEKHNNIKNVYLLNEYDNTNDSIKYKQDENEYEYNEDTDMNMDIHLIAQKKEIYDNLYKIAKNNENNYKNILDILLYKYDKYNMLYNHMK